MISMKRLLVAGLMAAMAAMPIGPAGHIGEAHAAQLTAAETSEMSNGGAWTTIIAQGKKKDDLKKDGYTCTRIATGFTECTKPGATTYWCDNSGSCEPKPRTADPQTPRSPWVDNRGGVYSTEY